jgi:hypothetical protein
MSRLESLLSRMSGPAQIEFFRYENRHCDSRPSAWLALLLNRAKTVGDAKFRL